MIDLQTSVTKYLAEKFDISASAAQAHAETLQEVIGFYAPSYAYCTHGCGCLLDGDDADRNECGCDGPCCDGEVAFVREGQIIALVETKVLEAVEPVLDR
jgi:hypothetical protein